MFISTILPILAWASVAWTVNKRLERGFSAALLLTACAFILILFLGLIFGSLRLTYYMILLGSLLQALFRGWTFEGVKRYLSSNKITFQGFRQSYIVLYICAAIAAYIFTNKVFPDFSFFGWDEFSHWARYTKILVDTSTAPVNNPSVLFPEYPPGINLWHYYICGPGGYAEWKVVFSHMLLVIVTITFVSTNFGTLKGLGTLAIFAFGLVLYHAFGTSLYEIYTDGVLGLLFAAGLVVARYIAVENNDKSALIGLAVILATITLIKPIAILFALAACGLFFGLRLISLCVYAIKSFHERKRVKPSDRDSVLTAIQEKPISFLRSSIQTLQLLLASFSTLIIWKFYTSANSVKAQLADSQQVGISEVFEFLFTRDTKETQIAWTELGDRIGFERISTFGGKQFRLDNGFLSPDIPIYHGAIYLLCATLVLFLIRLIFNHRKIIYITAEALYTSATFLIYLLVVVFITRYFFQLYDIERLASLERYLSSYLIGIMMYALTTLVTDVSNFKKQAAAQLHNFIMPVIWIGLSYYFIYKAPVALDNVFAAPLSERPVPGVHPWADEYDELAGLRNQIKTLSNVVRNNAKSDDRVFVISQNETGYTFYMAGHELSPLETNKSCFSLGEKYYETDNWTCDWVDLNITLLDYDFVLIRRADKKFWERFGLIFEPNARGSKSGVFKVDIDENKKIVLRAIYLSNDARGKESSP